MPSSSVYVTPKKLIAFGFAALILLFWLFTAVPARADQRLVTIHDGGQVKTVTTGATSIGEVLARAQIAVGKKDLVEPALSTPLVSPTYTVNIYRARPVMIVDGNNRLRVMTPYQSGRSIVKNTGLTLFDEDEVKAERIENVVADGALGLKVSIDRSVSLTLVLYGTPTPIRTQATTVQELLAEKDIRLAPEDGLSASLETPIVEHMILDVWRDGAQTKTEEQPIPFETEKIQNAEREVGYRQVKEPGQPGKKVVTYQIELKNGKEVARKEIQSIIIMQPKKQVEIVGSKYPPVAGPAEILERINHWSQARGIDANRVARIAKCESGFNPRADSGYYKGLFQHDPNYWPQRAARYGAGGASIFDAEAQIKVSTAMMAAGGWSHWGCK